MRMKSVIINNFRGYKDETRININDLTAFVGKNDIGKSTILEALDIFFNEGKGAIKIEKEDVNKDNHAAGNSDIEIAVIFEELPTSVVIDVANETALVDEYLLNSDGNLVVIKRYPNGGKEKVFIRALHPTNPLCADLLLKKDSELRTLISSLNIECNDRNKNAVMRTAIWNHYQDTLQLEEIDIDVTKGDSKSIWEKLQNYLPQYSLFQSDRKNSDGDSEVQDPLKEAVKQILSTNDIKVKFNTIALEVEAKLREVSQRTLAKLREMNPDIASSLNPVIPPSDSLKWTDVFKSVSISGDADIPINKRGSGVKRLILLNFFRAEAERRREEQNIPSIIYAIEEPETSQHTEHQKMLIRAFLTLSQTPHTQILITTHSAAVVKELRFDHLRLIMYENNQKQVNTVLPGQLPYPSLNEVNYLAFTEVTEEYHNELYGYIEAVGLLNTFIVGKPTMPYLRENRNGTVVQEDKILTEYIRHQIHHPENIRNVRYTNAQLKVSIELMRNFIIAQNPAV
jgi:predicted ATP-dependent endonuclease of OLD family